MLVKVGIPAYRYAFVPVTEPPGVVITTLTVPADARAGVVTVMDVSVFAVIAPVALAVPPKLTKFVPVKFVPVIVTDCPPASGPAAGTMLVKTGIAAYRYAFVPVAEPPAEVTTTSTVPDARAGVVTVIWVSLLTVIAPVALAVPPKVTDVTQVKFEPVIITDCPPATGPTLGVMLVNLGGGVVTVISW